jgi:hypothetical protein
MRPSRRLRPALVALAAAGAAVTSAPTAAAHEGPHGTHAARTLAHLDLSADQQPENLVLQPDGKAAVTFALTGQVAEVSRTGEVRVLARLPVPEQGDTPVLHSKVFAAGIDRAAGSLYVALSTGRAEETGVWRITEGQRPVRIAALPATALLNGLAVDERGGWIYVADSAQAVIWRVPLRGGTATAWYRSDALAPAAGFLGVNGVKVHRGAVWATNLDTGSLLRIPVRWSGAAGTAETVATGLGAVDDFAFTGRGDTVLVTDIKADTLVRLGPDGRTTTVLTAAEGLSSPTAVAVRGGRAVVTSAAYFTQQDPNITSVRLSR